MPLHTRVLVHTEGPALWPEHRSLENVLAIRDTTPSRTWWGTHQGLPTAPGGTVFLERWWAADGARYDPTDRTLIARCVGRYISLDTAESESENAAYTVALVGELSPDYRLYLRHVWRERVLFPDLEQHVSRLAQHFNADEKLRAIVIEDASSGTSLIQTLSMVGDRWIRQLVAPYAPVVSKEERANQSSVYCQNGMVVLPLPDAAVPWLVDFEDELFNFPGGEYADQVDAFAQLILYLEHYLARGYQKRRQAADS